MDIQRLTLACVRVGVLVACLVLFLRDELPVHALTFTVNVTGDQADLTLGTGACDTDEAAGNQCTLRAALQSAALNAGMDTINFDIGFGAKTITVGTALPIVNGPILIDGLTQQSGTQEFHVPCYLPMQHPCIEINGNGVNADGLVIAGGPATIRGLVINRFLGNGIRIYNSSSNNVIQYNYIGTNMDGTADLGNGNTFDEGGIRVSGTGNTIGGTTGFLPAFPTLPTANLISGNNNYGVILENGSTTGNTVLGNYIGTNRAGTAAIPNTQGGVLIDNSASSNMIGGTTGVTPGGSCVASCNLISGNGTSGVEILDGSTANTVLGNHIGTDTSGTMILGNHTGVFIGQAPGNTIGGTTPAARNVISGNDTFGVSIFGSGASANVIQGNYIGWQTGGGAALVTGTSGVQIEDADGTVIGGTTGTTPGGACTGACNLIFATNNGIHLFVDDPEAVTGTIIQGNFIGTNRLGTLSLNELPVGIRLSSANGGAVADNTIGGASPASRNLISALDGKGVVLTGLGTFDNRVQGNYIGTTTNGAVALGQRTGVEILDRAHDNTIGGEVGTTPGGPCTGACNVISGNDFQAVWISGQTGTIANVVAGNYIGTDPQGLGVNPNGSGIFLFGVSGNTVGGDNPAARNVISGNLGDGVYIVGDEAGQGDADDNLVANNYIGVRSDGNGDLGNGRHGVFISSSNPDFSVTNNVVEDSVISGNNSDGVRIEADNPDTRADNNTVRRNIIGLNAAGDTVVANNGNGVTLRASDAEAAVTRTEIGGSGPPPNRAGLGGDGNVISGNAGSGIEISGAQADQNGVYGNLIGTLADGMTAAGNTFFGARLFGGASENFVGWSGGGNVISANGTGIRIGDPTTTSNYIEGNYIGTNAAEDSGLGNTNEGIYVSNSPNNTIGGFNPGQGNVIRNNGAAGVRIQDADAVENRILGNSIDDNATLGIQLDAGANNDQEAPVLTAAKNGSTRIEGSLNSAPNSEYRIEFFASPECDDSDTGEGRVYLGVANVTTNVGGTAAIDVTIPATAAAGDVVTATAQDGAGNTSEFSNCVVVTGSATPTPSPTASQTATPTPTRTGPTPTGGATATPTPTPTDPTPTGGATPTPTATPTPKNLVQGDVQCDGDVDSVDALQQLRDVAGLPTFHEDGCPGIGAAGTLFGDVDCDADVDSVDALKVLRYVAALSVSQDEPCPDIGAPL